MSLPALHLAQSEAADAMLSRDPFALLTGMLLDQQVTIEQAFSGPLVIAERLGTGDRLDPVTVADADPDEFAALCAARPAVHRYPAAMAGRVQALARVVVDEYGGDAAALWTGVPDAVELRRRLEALPGFGKAKAAIFLALLAKQLGVRPQGWREAAGTYGEDGAFRSVADITGGDSLALVRESKRQAKAAGKPAATTAPAATARPASGPGTAVQ